MEKYKYLGPSYRPQTLYFSVYKVQPVIKEITLAKIENFTLQCRNQLLQAKFT